MAETTEKAGIEILYPEIMALIFCQLDSADKCQAVQVCVDWRDAAYCRTVWRGAKVFLDSVEPDPALLFSLTKRGINQVHIVDKNWLSHVISALPDLHFLSLQGCEEVTDGILADCFQHSRPLLTELNLSGSSLITTVSIALVVQRFPYLKSLDVSCCFNMTDRELHIITDNLSKLTLLNVGGCREISNTGISILADGKPGLEVLGLKACRTLRNDTIMFLVTGLLSLRSLDLSYNEGVKDSGMKHLVELKSLRQLNLTGCNGVTYFGMRWLLRRGPSRLTDLTLAKCDGINDRALRYLAELSDLRRLDVSCCPGVGDKGMANLLKYSSKLEYLKLGPLCNVTTEGMKKLTKLPNLRGLDMSGCDYVDSAGLGHLVRVGSPLIFLDIRGCHEMDSKSLFRIAGGAFDLRVLLLDSHHVDNDGLVLASRYLSKLEKIMCGRQNLLPKLRLISEGACVLE